MKFIKSIIQIHELTPPSRHVDSPIKTTIHVEESSFELQFQHVSASLTQQTKGKKHHEFQNTTMEINYQTQSTPVHNI